MSGSLCRGPNAQANMSSENSEVITAAVFRRRLTALCSGRGLTSFPRRQRDRHILLKSVTLTLDRKREYAEPELNLELQLWLSQVGESFHLDHINLRRHLIDEEFLGRSKDGSRYWVAVSSRRQLQFDPSVESLDVYSLIGESREKERQRKERFLQSGSPGLPD